jgi:hypothetical protein
MSVAIRVKDGSRTDSAAKAGVFLGKVVTAYRSGSLVSDLSSALRCLPAAATSPRTCMEAAEWK